jgi:hypothetical protein
MHCGSSLLCHIAASSLLLDQRSCVRPSKQGLDAVQYRTSKTTNVKAKHTRCSGFFLQTKRAIVAAQNTNFAKLALIDLRRHGGVKVPHLAPLPRHAVSLLVHKHWLTTLLHMQAVPQPALRGELEPVTLSANVEDRFWVARRPVPDFWCLAFPAFRHRDYQTSVHDQDVEDASATTVCNNSIHALCTGKAHDALAWKASWKDSGL